MLSPITRKQFEQVLLQRCSWSLPCLLLQPSSEQQGPKGIELGLSPFHLTLLWDLATLPTFLQQAAASPRSFTLLTVAGLAHLQVGTLLVWQPQPEVPHLSSLGSGLGAGFPPAFVSTESRCWHGSEQPPAEIILIMCAAGSAPLCLTW